MTSPTKESLEKAESLLTQADTAARLGPMTRKESATHLIALAIDDAVRAEREVAARIALGFGEEWGTKIPRTEMDRPWMRGYYTAAKQIAQAIRTRTEAPEEGT